MTTHHHQDVDRALASLRETPVFSAEWERALAERVRRDVMARYGSFIVPAPSAVHTTEQAPRGMLFLPLRLTGALGVAVVLAFGAFTAMRVGGDGDVRLPTISTSAPVVENSAELVVSPGSGNALSVFSTVEAPAMPNRIQNHPAVTPRPRAITPAPGVFTTWGSSVFTEEERVKNAWEGKNVFSS